MNNQQILYHIGGYIHGCDEEFFERFFSEFEYESRGDCFEIRTLGGITSRCELPRAIPRQDHLLWPWVFYYLTRQSDRARGSWSLATNDATSENGDAKGSASFLLSMPASPDPTAQTRWVDVQVVGQAEKSLSVGYQEGLIRLCQSAQKVFSNQPLRLFLHGFYMRGQYIEYWVFDRSGLYCSPVVLLKKEPELALSYLLSYQRMTDKQLGRSDLIQSDEGGSYVFHHDEGKPCLGKLYLENHPIVSAKEIVGEGITCFRARNPESTRWDYVLKLKWQRASDRSKGEPLSIGRDRQAMSAISVHHYEEIARTSKLRPRPEGVDEDGWDPYSRLWKYKPDIPKRKDEIRPGNIVLWSHTKFTRRKFEDRILSCTITSIVGRSVDTFRSLTELLQVFRDCIKCYRTLYFDTKVLHRNISPGTMIIPKEQGEGGPNATLIDLDSAIYPVGGLEPLFRVMGTRPFMAIGVLKRERHTYRHDLESFLYAFLWTVIANHMEDPPVTSRLRQWSENGWNELAEQKSLDMDQTHFQSLLEEFADEYDCLKPLAERLRRILFPLRDGAIWTGTDEEPQAAQDLHNEVIRAFEEAIESEGGGKI